MTEAQSQWLQFWTELAALAHNHGDLDATEAFLLEAEKCDEEPQPDFMPLLAFKRAHDALWSHRALLRSVLN